MYEKQIKQTYFRELFGSIFVYVVVLFACAWFLRDYPDGPIRSLVAVIPTIPILGMFWAILRHFKRMDEYQRQLNIECAAMAAGLTAFFSMTYYFLEGVGFPRLSMLVIWAMLMISWGGLVCLRRKIGR